MKSPRILLTAGHPTPTEPYEKAIAMAGGKPVVMKPGDGTELPPDIDGVVLAGGASVEPARYNSPIEAGVTPTMDTPRDALEFDVLSAAIDAGLPVLGICRGLQLINVHFGGKLYQELALTEYAGVHRPEAARNHLAHTVTANGGRLLKIMGPQPRGVNSIHRQGVRELAPTLAATVVADDGLVEGVEALDGQIVAVQWHPEELVDQDPIAAALFTDLVERIADRSRRQQQAS